jgi:hypothetical protein
MYPRSAHGCATLLSAITWTTMPAMERVKTEEALVTLRIPLFRKVLSFAFIDKRFLEKRVLNGSNE